MKTLAASALAAAAALFAASPAMAVCTAANAFSYAFASQAATQLAYGSTYNYTASTTGGATRPFTVAVLQNGMTSTMAASVQMPRIGNTHTGPDATKNNLVIGGAFGSRTADMASGTRTASAVFTFAQPVRDFAVTVHDIDFGANQFRDWLMVTGVGGAVTYTPALTTPHGNNNATGGPRTAAASSVTFGPGTTPVTLTASQGAGTATAGNNSNTGTVTATFAQPVTVITVRYGNAPLTSGETVTGQQAIGIEGISFCPMPQVTVAKTSEPIAGPLGAYDLPGNDVTYSFTVTNTGGSPVDAGTLILTDALPARITFRNTSLDATTGAPFAINAGTSGVTLPAGSGAFSNNGGASYAYAPAAGYDAAVNAIRVTPSGSMAANSSFTVSFVGRVK